MRLESKKVAYEAQASLAAPTGSAAVASLASAVRASPRDRAIRRRYADALKALGLLEEARREYEACADLSPLDASLRIAIGSIWELLRREDLALSEYRKALALDPESNIAQLKVTDLSSRVAR
jgi:tetratricopeptide (TPR) repeat protein